jgi:predicted RNase H-like HicB family nuclease
VARLRKFNVVIEKDEHGMFVGTVPELPGCHSQAGSEAELLERIKEAIALYIDVNGEPAAETEFIGVKQVEVEA